MVIPGIPGITMEKTLYIYSNGISLTMKKQHTYIEMVYN